MKIPYEWLRKNVSSTRLGVMDIYRHGETENEDGSVDTEGKAVIVIGAPCRFSYAYSDSAKQHADLNNVDIVGTVYCDIEVDVKSGDFVEVTLSENGRKLNGHISEPDFWISNRQFTIERNRLS